MTPSEIKGALISKGISLTEIANATGTSVSEVSRCISGDGLYLKIREEIARRLAKSVKRVFSKRTHPQPQKRSWCKAA
ncbi:MAG TPA: helix-turn-helix transcriptional regulator [Pyrinomonadaceae bacterium]|nr:helix-turn-helix transcriptional regulator [Pyrinomonadaceae bacterium]